MKSRYPSLITFAIIAFCIWNSHDLIYSWITSPLEQNVFFIFFLWILPIFFFWVGKPAQSYSGNPFLLIIALILSIAGIIGTLNALNYWGLAFALAALIPWSNWWLLWIGCAIAWMPMAGWIGAHIPSISETLFMVLRGVLVFIGSTIANKILKTKFGIGKKE